MTTAILAPAYGFSWPILSKEQYPIAQGLYDRYCDRFKLPRGGNPGGQYWLGIVEMVDDVPGRLCGVLGIDWDKDTKMLAIAGLYVFPTRRGARAFEATLKRAAELYDQGFVKFVGLHVLVENRKIERKVAQYFEPRGGGVRAHLWTVGSIGGS